MLKKRLIKSRYKLMAAIMYSSGESRPLIKYVSYTMYPLNRIVPPIAYRRSIVLEKGMNIPTIPVIQRAMRPPKSHGPMPEKSYLDWKVKIVKPKKTPKVINKACRTIALSKNAHNIPRVKASRSVNVDRRMRLRGCAWRFQ